MLQRYRKRLPARLFDLIPMAAVRYLTRERPLGPFYHVVSDRRLPHLAHLYSYVGTDAFEQHLKFLRSNFRMLSVREIAASMRGGRPLPPHAAFLSFDDGLAECFSVVRPLLLKHGIPCVFFVCRDFTDNRNMFYRHAASLCVDAVDRLEALSGAERATAHDDLSDLARTRIDSSRAARTWILNLRLGDADLIHAVARALGCDIEDYLRRERPYLTSAQLAALVNDGFDIGAHTTAHQDLREGDDAAAVDQIVTSCAWTCRTVKAQSVSFSFPFSGRSVGRPALQRLLESNPCVELIFDAAGLKDDAPFIVNRIWAEDPRPGTRPSGLAHTIKTQVGRHLDVRNRPTRRAALGPPGGPELRPNDTAVTASGGSPVLNGQDPQGIVGAIGHGRTPQRPDPSYQTDPRPESIT